MKMIVHCVEAAMPKITVYLLVILALSACNLTRTPPSAAPTSTPDSVAESAKPTVTISSPKDGDELVVGTDLLVSANATDSVGITRVQLIANNQIVKTVSSEAATGDTSMNVLLDYKPTTTGQVDLEVIAYRGAVASEPAEVMVTVRANQSQVTATIIPQTDVPVIDPNDPTCRALINVGLNVRTGPATSFPRITTLQPGSQVPIVGRTGDNAWWQVRVGGSIGWVVQRNPSNPNEEFATILGVCTFVPIINPPPTLTVPPPPTLTVPPPTLTVPPPTLTPTTIPVTNTPRPADLVVISISGDNTLTIPTGETSITETFSVTITNNGEANTGQFNNTVQVLPGGPVLELGVVGNLGANESIALAVDLTFEAGEFTIRVEADSDNSVPEASEFNNRGELDVLAVAGS
jgi:hypothetical protein